MTTTALEKQKISKKRSRIKKQRQFKEALWNKKRENEQVKGDFILQKSEYIL